MSSEKLLRILQEVFYEKERIVSFLLDSHSHTFYFSCQTFIAPEMRQIIFGDASF